MLRRPWEVLEVAVSAHSVRLREVQSAHSLEDNFWVDANLFANTNEHPKGFKSVTE